MASKTCHVSTNMTRTATAGKSTTLSKTSAVPIVCIRTDDTEMPNLERRNTSEHAENGSSRSKSGLRKCRARSADPASAKFISRKDFESLQARARYVPEEERKAALERAENEKERMARESMKRKEAFRKMDMKRNREKDARLNEIEEEARKRTMHLLERAHNLRLEREEEIQKCNRIILETKCRAIRDAQMAEKKLIERELAEEEKRLNDMMENERRWTIKEDLKREAEEAAKRREFAKVLKEQIIENEEQRIIEFERKQEESRLINLSNIAWMQEEVASLQSKKAERTKIRQQLHETNEQLKHFKAMEEEENRVIDFRIREYQRLKDEREAKLAEEQRREKLKKEREITRIAARVMHNQHLQTQLDEVNAARVQEEVEREWRKKEKEEAMKKSEAIRALQVEREEQINSKRVMQAIEIERDKREFEKIVRVQKEAFCREMKELEKKQQQALSHRRAILKQVNEKERERIEARQKMFDEGLAIRTEAEIRRRKLRDAIVRKCEEMRENKVPEVYINEVKRMIENVQ